MLIAGGVVVLVVVALLAYVVLGKSSTSKPPTSSPVSTVVSTSNKTASAHAKKSSHTSTTTSGRASVANPAETTVAVLNGTETTGLAHRVSSALQQNGYSQANALSGRPPGSGQTTVVEYSSGHQAEAEGVARSLSVKQVQPLEGAVAGLAGSAQVVVIVGANTTVP